MEAASGKGRGLSCCGSLVGLRRPDLTQDQWIGSLDGSTWADMRRPG